MVRFIHLYLIGYFALTGGAALALWRAGVLARIPGIWLVAAATTVVGLGILLAVSSRPPTTIAPE